MKKDNKAQARALRTLEGRANRPSTQIGATLSLSKGRESLDTVSELTTNRLSVYLRCLNALDGAGVRTVSSQALAEQFHLNAAQIRKDLAYFGEFGVRGVGYYVRELRSHLRQILGLDQRVRVGIMGAGNLGLALADYPGFQIEGFEIAALFDTVQEKIGEHSRGGVPIFDIADYGIVASRRESLTGVWVDDRKITSIGVGVRYWITMHGFALNVCDDLSPFNHIVPCGINKVAMTSIERETGTAFPVAEVAIAFETIASQRISDLRIDQALSAVGASCL